eukprot:3308840-Pleurochrysis_carterae.AAC.1
MAGAWRCSRCVCAWHVARLAWDSSKAAATERAGAHRSSTEPLLGFSEPAKCQNWREVPEMARNAWTGAKCQDWREEAGLV